MSDRRLRYAVWEGSEIIARFAYLSDAEHLIYKGNEGRKLQIVDTSDSLSEAGTVLAWTSANRVNP